MAWVPAQDDMAWKRASTGRGSMPPQKTSFEPHARPPDSFRKPRQGDLILFSQISSIRNEGRHEVGASIGLEAGYTQMGAGIASRLGRAFRLRRSELRLIVGCGAAAAISAGFNAPRTGAVYAGELIIGTYPIGSL